MRQRQTAAPYRERESVAIHGQPMAQAMLVPLIAGLIGMGQGPGLLQAGTGRSRPGALNAEMIGLETRPGS